MTRLGSDTDALTRVGRTLDDLGTRLDAALAGLTREVATTRWRGADADRFRDEWSLVVRPRTQRVVASLRAAGADVARQVAEQERASLADDVGRAVAVAARPLHVAAAPPLPSRVRLVTVEIGGGEGVLGWFTDRVRIEELGGGRSRVTSEAGLGAGAGVGWGNRASASAGDRAIVAGAAVDAAIGAGVHVGSAWVVPDDRVDDLLVQIAASHVDVRAPDQLRMVDRLVPGIGRVADVVGLGGMWDRVTYAPPSPDRLEVGVVGLADLDLGAQLSGSASVGAVVAAAGSAMVSVARHPSSGETSVRMVGDGAAEAALGDRAASGRGVVATTLTFDREGRPSRVEVERTVRTGDRTDVERWSRAVGEGADPSWLRQSSTYGVAGRGEVDLGLGAVSVTASYEDIRRVR